MIARISDEDLADIRENLRFVEVMSEYTALNPAGGRSLLGVCPCCRELQLEVAMDRKTWYCHGCLIGGDAINFVQIAADTTFPKAVRRVCELSGLPEPKFELVTNMPQRVTWQCAACGPIRPADIDLLSWDSPHGDERCRRCGGGDLTMPAVSEDAAHLDQRRIGEAE